MLKESYLWDINIVSIMILLLPLDASNNLCHTFLDISSTNIIFLPATVSMA